jgi:acetyl-CoA carboxylase biotin carboxylase subunit
MGDKVAAKRAMADLGLPVVPGSDGPVDDADTGRALAAEIGYPVLLKAAAGGGGRGMKRVGGEAELAPAMVAAKAESLAAFGDDTLYLEKYLERPRHIEIQVLGDGRGKVVHLGERDCSLQRRHQKILEETPSPALNAPERQAICARVVEAMAEISYRGVGTVEFLYADGEFYFIEMNTRLQVEHPITEATTNIDLVREQLRIAAGVPLELTQETVRAEGHAIECRINAEDPWTLAPSPGRITEYHPPGGLGVRVDSALYAGYRVPPDYDSLIAKLVVHGRTRNDCLMRLRRALEEFVVGGIETNIPLHLALMWEPDFVDGDYHIHWLETFLERSRPAS